MKKVFISYPSESREIVNLLIGFLRRKDVPVWCDMDKIEPAQRISDRLIDGVRESACCIFLLNKHSVESNWCMAEVGAFWGAGKPILIYPIEPSCDVPEYLAGLRRVKDSSELAKTCKKIIDRVKPPLSPPPTQNTLLELFTRCGLTNAFRIPVDDHAREKRVAELVANERSKSGASKFRLLASSGFNYLHKMGKVWRAELGEAILEEDAEFSVVLESPFSAFAYACALASQVEHHHWYEKVDINHIIELDKKDNVIIKVTEYPVNCSLFFTSEAVFYDPYLWAKPKKSEPVENHFWVFDFKKLDKPYYNRDYECYDLLKLHFNFLFDNSIPLKEFLGEEQENYKKGTEEFKYKLKEIKESKV